MTRPSSLRTNETGRPKPRYARDDLTVHSDPNTLRRVTKALRGGGRRVTLVPTMGALHEGHRELMRRARSIPGSTTVVSIFVNPRQFGPHEDFDRYPRAFEADLQMCREEGVELVFAPDVETMYPAGFATSIDPGPLGDQLEGAARPGHFGGMLTVVNKLFAIAAPDVVFFGEKDYQQLTLIRRMVRDLDIDVHVVGVPTVREQDGLARSSRNAYLDDDGRRAAVAISAALTAGRYAGEQGPAAVVAAARGVLEGEAGLDVEYVELRDPDLGPAPEIGPARLLIAARAGTTRLIDNAAVSVVRKESGLSG
ncbi:pantoate--beta-alanine ligase [Actinomycetospora endophytica]|uniref:Pantothenate synthetase n=1 Tax=Actinomycetospora endophytica TaxID=2291215 RepID=A0ABS8P715_9PSEU|nr:pantoate--beta-alanine ligase [Actinomycetospora endophytica]MCD2194039.1 pantoate--beta-alanine ligase [Actinomycetospora endophytica]